MLTIDDLRDRRTIPLYPDTGQLLGISKNSTYAAAKRGEIPGLLRIGSRYVVSTHVLLKALGVDPDPVQSPDPSPVQSPERP